MNPELLELLIELFIIEYFLGGFICFSFAKELASTSCTGYYFKTKGLSTLGVICKRVLLFGGFIIMLILITFVNLFIIKKIKY